MKRVFSFNSELHKLTGVQKVLVDIHEALKEDYVARIVGLKPYKTVNIHLRISNFDYIQLKNPFIFFNSIVIVHERKFLLFFWILNHLLFQRIKIVYVHHNLLYGHRMTTILPKTIVCISESGRQNLINEFGAKAQNIHKIYNCTIDRYSGRHRQSNRECIKVLYPARINNVKRQEEIVRRIGNRLDRRVHLLFAGDGPQYKELKNIIGRDSLNIKCMGFVSDVYNLMKDCDFILLFSVHEGLPISLIEATMMGMPIICNDVGGNTEIAIEGQNAIVVNDWEGLIMTLNQLPKIDDETYRSLCQRSRYIYEEKFTFEKFKENYHHLLENL